MHDAVDMHVSVILRASLSTGRFKFCDRAIAFCVAEVVQIGEIYIDRAELMEQASEDSWDKEHLAAEMGGDRFSYPSTWPAAWMDDYDKKATSHPTKETTDRYYRIADRH